MSTHLTPLERCREIAGLSSHEMMIGVAPSEKHEDMLSKYIGARRSLRIVRMTIVADLRAALAAGALLDAADLIVVLRRLLTLDARAAQFRRPDFRQRFYGGARSARARTTMPNGSKNAGEPSADIIPFAAL